LRLNKILYVLLLITILASVLNAQTTSWRLIWNLNPPSDSVLYYEIYIGEDSNSVSLIDTVNHPNTEYRDSLGIGGEGLNLGQVYFYRIKAVNIHGSGPYSNAAYESIPKIEFDNLTLPVSTDTTFSLNQSLFVSDSAHGISWLEWNVDDPTGGDPIQHLMTPPNIINFNTPPDSTIKDTLIFTVTDTSGFYDESSISITLSSIPPVVTDIPDQTIANDSIFSNIILDDYVTDLDHNDNQLNWTVFSADCVDININSSRIASIVPVNSDWVGADTVIFRVTDPTFLFDEDQVIFTILGRPVVSDIPDTSIQKGSLFPTFDLDDYVYDPDHNDNELTWMILDTINLRVGRDISNMVTITPKDTNWTGSEAIRFIATDPNNLSDEDIAMFSIVDTTTNKYTPQITSASITIAFVDSLYEYKVTAEDMDGDILDIFLDSNYHPSFLQQDATQLDSITNSGTSVYSRRIWARPIKNDTGTHQVRIQVNDGRGRFDIQDYDLEVIDNSSPPADSAFYFTSTPDTIAILRELYSYKVTAFNPSGDSLFFLPGLFNPPFLNYNVLPDTSNNSDTLLVFASFNDKDIGEHQVTIYVTDGISQPDTQNFVLSVRLFLTESVTDDSISYKVYPNPWVESELLYKRVFFENFPENSELLIFNLVGEPVVKTEINNQLFMWDVKNNSGLGVQSGLYFYYVREGSKILSSGKIVIIR